MNRPSGAFKQTERSCESKMEGSHPDKLTVDTEMYKALQVQKSSKASQKKRLTKNRFCGKIIKSSAAKAEAHRTLKIEQYRKNL